LIIDLYEAETLCRWHFARFVSLEGNDTPTCDHFKTSLFMRAPGHSRHRCRP